MLLILAPLLPLPRVGQIVENVIEESTVYDIYTYKGSDGDEPMVPPFTRINTGNTFE